MQIRFTYWTAAGVEGARVINCTGEWAGIRLLTQFEAPANWPHPPQYILAVCDELRERIALAFEPTRLAVSRLDDAPAAQALAAAS